MHFSWSRTAHVNCQVRYTLATKLNPTRRLCWKSIKSTVLLWPRTHWRRRRPSWRQCRPRQAVEIVADLSPVSVPVDFVARLKTLDYWEIKADCFWFAELGLNKLTVGKIYAGMLIAENWRAYKTSKSQGGGNTQVQFILECARVSFCLSRLRAYG